MSRACRAVVERKIEGEGGQGERNQRLPPFPHTSQRSLGAFFFFFFFFVSNSPSFARRNGPVRQAIASTSKFCRVLSAGPGTLSRFNLRIIRKLQLSALWVSTVYRLEKGWRETHPSGYLFPPCCRRLSQALTPLGPLYRNTYSRPPLWKETGKCGSHRTQ